jgi:hypothetical protein
VELNPANPDLIEMTKMILEQNRLVLEMNAKLLPLLAHQSTVVRITGDVPAGMFDTRAQRAGMTGKAGER